MIVRGKGLEANDECMWAISGTNATSSGRVRAKYSYPLNVAVPHEGTEPEVSVFLLWLLLLPALNDDFLTFF